MYSKRVLILLFGVSAVAFTGCEGMFTPEVINEVNERNDGETTQPIHAYVQFEGLEGEASTEGYEGWSRIFSLKDGVTNVPGLFGGDEPGKAEFEPIRIVKQQDTASPALFQHLVESTHIPRASIAVLRDSHDGPFEYYRYDLENVYIAKYQLGEPDHHHGTPTVVIEPAFTKITITYTPLEDDGSPGAPVTASWDLLAQTK